MKLEFTKSAFGGGYKWVSVESLLKLSPKELLDEVRKLHMKRFDAEKDKIKELE